MRIGKTSPAEHDVDIHACIPTFRKFIFELCVADRLGGRAHLPEQFLNGNIRTFNMGVINNIGVILKQ